MMRILFPILCTLTLGSAFAQRCHTMEFLKWRQAYQPSIIQEMEILNRTITTWKKKSTPFKRTTDSLLIPVVVHVVWNLPEENISNDQIQSQITVLNEDFNASNEDLSKTPALFSEDIANMEIRFCLAKVDPMENATDGITRTSTSIPNIGTTLTNGRRNICYTELGGRDAWDPDKYLNIWVGARQGSAGDASFPGQDVLAEDGIRIAPNRFGRLTGTVESPYELGRTATHEVGHYLNLRHLWGSCTEGGENPLCCPGIDPTCTCDDGIEDTPPLTNTYLNECQIDNNNNTCFDQPGGPDKFDMSMNFMTFSDDACMVMFSNGQKEVVQATLSTVRKSLVEGNRCTFTTSTHSNPPRISLNIVPNPASTVVNVEFSPNFVEADLQLINLAGQVVLRKRITADRNRLSIEEFPNGFYWFKVTFPGALQVQKPLVINR